MLNIRISIIFLSMLLIGCPKASSSGSSDLLGVLAFLPSGQASDTPVAKIEISYNGVPQESGATIDFGTEIINLSETNGKSISLIVKNTGTTELQMPASSAIVLSGSHTDSFTVVQPNKTSLAAGESTTVQIRFHPIDLGINNSSISISSNDEGISNFRLSLTGTGGPAAPRIAVNTGSTNISNNGAYTIGTVVSESSGSPVSFTVRNSGSLQAVLNAPVVESSNSQFVISGSTAGATLAVDGNFTFNVTFSPTSPGVKNGTIVVNYTLGGSPATFIFNISGTATPIPVPTIAISHNSSDYTSGGSIPTFGVIWPSLSSSSKTITIQNNGSANMTGLVVTEFSGDTTHFETSVLSTGSTNLAAGASATFTVRFSPSSTGAKSMVLRVNSTNGNNGTSSSANINVTGTGKTGADVLVSWTATNEKAVNATDGGYKICYSKSSGFNPSAENGTTIFCNTQANSGGNTPNSKVISVNTFGTWYFKVYAFGKYNTTGGAPSSESSVVVPST
jgi:hypothetical protein